jgi:hypothetical protein
MSKKTELEVGWTLFGFRIAGFHKTLTITEYPRFVETNVTGEVVNELEQRNKRDKKDLDLNIARSGS